MTIPLQRNQPYTLIVLTGEEERHINLTTELMNDADTLIQKMDQDMDLGIQLSRRFIPSPGQIERCQIVANRLLTALHTQNDASATLMAAYLITRLPTLKTAAINIDGEAEETLFYDDNDAVIQ